MTTPSVARTILVAVVVLTPVAVLATWVLNEWDDGHLHTSRPVGSVSQPAPEPSEPTSLLTKVRVRADGVLRVRQWVRSTEPMTSMVVAAPIDPYLELGTVTATRLEVRADGVRLEGPDEVTLDSAAFAFEESRSIRLSYLLAGALERTAGSTRALARVTSLDLFVTQEQMPTTYVFDSAHILNLACTRAGSRDLPEPCGAREGGDWVVRMAEPGAGLSRVMVQLDLAPSVAAGTPRSS